jgi:hypothetical protein
VFGFIDTPTAFALEGAADSSKRGPGQPNSVPAPSGIPYHCRP